MKKFTGIQEKQSHEKKEVIKNTETKGIKISDIGEITTFISPISKVPTTNSMVFGYRSIKKVIKNIVGKQNRKAFSEFYKNNPTADNVYTVSDSKKGFMILSVDPNTIIDMLTRVMYKDMEKNSSDPNITCEVGKEVRYEDIPEKSIFMFKDELFYKTANCSYSLMDGNVTFYTRARAYADTEHKPIKNLLVVPVRILKKKQ